MPILCASSLSATSKKPGNRDPEGVFVVDKPHEAVDPDVDLHVVADRTEFTRSRFVLITVIAVGGGFGAVVRYGISLGLPTQPGQFPLATFVINIVGCVLLGVLMALIRKVRSAHPLLRPFLGVGVLGGFTTFSTYANEVRDLLHPGTALLGLCYLAGSAISGLIAVACGSWLVMLIARAGIAMGAQ